MNRSYLFASRPGHLAALALGILLAADAAAQSDTAAEPIVGLRRNPPRLRALRGARIVTEPGRVLENGTLLIDRTTILAVGSEVEIPPDAEVIDCTGKTLYPGWIDAWGEEDVSLESSDGEAAHWNNYITPQRSARGAAAKVPSDAEKRRGQGFTARLVAPRGGILKGTSAVALLGGDRSGGRLLNENAFLHLQLTVPRRGGSRSRYPNSPMGAVALLRQTLLDAGWYRDAWTSYRSQPGLPRPETNRALQVLSEAMRDGTFVADCPNERMAIRAGKLAEEFSLRMVLRGSGREYRRLEEIIAGGRPLLVPVDFPEPPNVSTAERAADVELRDLMHWRLAPENPGRCVAAGAKICLTTDGLEDPAKFLQRVREAVKRGLAAEDALAALTTTPAELLGINDVAGRLAPGLLANLLVADGDLFATDGRVLETWIAGERFMIEDPPQKQSDAIAGAWRLVFPGGSKTPDLDLELTADGKQLRAKLRLASQGSTPGDGEGAGEGGDEQVAEELKLGELVRHRDRLTANARLSKLSGRFAEGVWQLTLLTIASGEDRPEIEGSLLAPDGTLHRVRVRFLRPESDRREASEEDVSEEKADHVEEEEAADAEQKAVASAGVHKDDAAGAEKDADRVAQSEPPSIPVTYPLGAYGLTTPPEQPDAVLFRGGTVWTCGPEGVIENGDVLVRGGRIAEVGTDLTPPDGCQIIDVRGKHVTPGLIDCHSHMATDGGVNESGQAVTAEVRIGDFVDNSDIHIYRQLAGGLTTSNILHGSANPIGGQNQVIKLRWGESMDGMRMEQAPLGIKFALGENVKRSTSRYPNTRMGVEQIIRDQLLAAREYAARWNRWHRGERDRLPPRRDLQLEALAEVQRGERWIHCHSYRQDEILATLEVLEEFGIQIGTLQHILEGYKVADAMARHGAMASAFSDWWAYKFEVYDAIPYNGVLMHEAGIVVSYNSDDRELGRHMNTEAAKAVKYGGVPPEEALKFVTLNPAKQLRIDQYVGSLEAGKHADLAVWSGPPLSTTSRCEQTWIDGRCYFDLDADRALRQRDAELRHRLVQLILDDSRGDDGDGEGKKGGQEEVAEEDRWVRYDVYCNARGGQDARREQGFGRAGGREQQLQQETQR